MKQISTDLTCCASLSLPSDSDESPVARERTIIVHANHNQLSLCEEDLSIGGHLHRTRDSGCQTDDFLIACMFLCTDGKCVICLKFRGTKLDIRYFCLVFDSQQWIHEETNVFTSISRHCCSVQKAYPSSTWPSGNSCLSVPFDRQHFFTWGPVRLHLYRRFRPRRTFALP